MAKCRRGGAITTKVHTQTFTLKAFVKTSTDRVTELDGDSRTRCLGAALLYDAHEIDDGKLQKFESEDDDELFLLLSSSCEN